MQGFVISSLTSQPKLINSPSISSNKAFCLAMTDQCSPAPHNSTKSPYMSFMTKPQEDISNFFGPTSESSKTSTSHASRHESKPTSTIVGCANIIRQSFAPTSLLQPLTIMNVIWDELSIDLIEGLPFFSRFNIILVIMDQLNKHAHLYILK